MIKDIVKQKTKCTGDNCNLDLTIYYKGKNEK